MLKTLRIFLALLALWPMSHALAQQGPNGEQLSTRSLLADTAAVEGGKPFYAGFHFKLADGWHTYWQWAGSPGFPLKVTWELPSGWQAGPVEFPLPHAATDTYDQTSFGYDKEVLFLVKVTPPAKVEGEAKLTAKIKWQVCEKSCIVGNDTLSLTLPPGAAAPANADLSKKWMAQLPKTEPAPTKDVKFESKDKALVVSVGGLLPGVKAEFFPIPPPDFFPTFAIGEKLGSETKDGVRVFKYPFGEDVTSEGWGGLLVLEKEGEPRTGFLVGAAAGKRSEPGAATPTSKEPPTRSTAPAAETKSGETSSTLAFDPFAAVKAKGDGPSFATLLLSGFIGGFILNLMPCVLPVIGLKILGFVSQAGNSRRRTFQLGLAFCGGVFAFFYILALATILLKSSGVTLTVGWQFQYPYMLAGMLALFTAFALSLLGVFELELSGGVSSKLSKASRQEGLGGAFVHGFFTTLMGFSCTAPFAAAPLGAALSQPGLRAFGLFTAVAAGLCLPYFLLTLNPAWMRFVPKPGTWMIRFKQIMGFVLLGFVVFFFNAMASRGPDAVSATLYFLLAVGIACWLVGAYHEKRWRWPVAALGVVAAWFGLVHGSFSKAQATPVAAVSTRGETAAGTWEPYTARRLSEALQKGQPVFIDFTADWCLNCKFYEKTVLGAETIKAALKEKGVLLLKGDVTHEDSEHGKEATAALEKFGRAGVPYYVLFRKPGDYWSSDSLSQDGFMAELKKL